MEPQEIFDTVAKHLFTMGHRVGKGQGEGFVCQYRNMNNEKCAAGVLLPDEFYDLEMEGKTWLAISLDRNFSIPKWMVTHEYLIDELQYIHDTLDNWKTSDVMKNKLTSVAQKYQLNFNILKNLKFSWES